MERKKISIVTPCFNEEEGVRACREAVTALFDCDGPLAHYDHEHIFADNASQDATAAILREMADADPRVKVILNSRNFGAFRSHFNALRAATGDAVLVFLPADLQDPPEVLPEMVKFWESGVEIVAGARATRDESWPLRTGRAIFYRLVRGFSEIDLPLNVGEFQLIDRKVFDAIKGLDDHYPYTRGIIAWAGFKRMVIPYHWQARRAGISSQNIWRMIDQALNAVVSFTNAPLRLCIYGGLSIALLSTLYALFAVTAALFKPQLAPPGTMTIITAIFFFGSVQLVVLGVIGEYVSSIHNQVRKRPIVVERERINFDG